MTEATEALPNAFIWRRLHSLTGLFLVLYLFEHLLVNSQAALWIGDDGAGFVRAVNAIHDLPYLPAIEFFLLGVPIALHAILGVKYLQTSKANSRSGDGTVPSLRQYTRNHAYTWQRITSWILLFAILFHVIHMRFLEYPSIAHEGGSHWYAVRVEPDSGLATIADRLDVKVFQADQVPARWASAIAKHPLKPGEALVQTSSFGMAELFVVRETFKMPIMIAIYTILVLSACYHGLNGLWTFMISWGITLSQRSQKGMLVLCYGLMGIVTFFGLAAIWGG